jgi:hypothetical protein
MQFELCGNVYPDSSAFHEKPIAVRGRELVRKTIVPAHEDPKWNQRTAASSRFVHCFNREPAEGDLLRWEHVRVINGPEFNLDKYQAQIEAWNRQLPHLPCPLKFENDRLFKRLRTGEWFEAVDVNWGSHWRHVEDEARSFQER